MIRFLRLVAFFAVRRARLGTSLLFLSLIVVLLLVGFLATAARQNNYSRVYGEFYGAGFPLIPLSTLETGSAHTQVWEVTNRNLLIASPARGGILLPLRLATRWLFVVLPLAGLLLSSREVSQDLESGVAQTVYSAPISPMVLGMSRVLGDSFSTSVLIGLGLVGTLLIANRVANLQLTYSQLVRGVTFVMILGIYTSVFILIGNLVSALTRHSVRAVWLCVGIGLAVFTVHLAGENLLTRYPPPYPTVPRPPRIVNQYLAEQTHQPESGGSTAEEEEAEPAVQRYLLELAAHAIEVHDMIDAVYQRERWFGLISPVHAIWEVAGQVLQESHRAATDIMAPYPAEDPPPSVTVSLRQALPELLIIVGSWLLFFVLNAWYLARLEV